MGLVGSQTHITELKDPELRAMGCIMTLCLKTKQKEREQSQREFRDKRQ